MTWTPDRRTLLGTLSLTAAATLTPRAFARAVPKVVIIGGGFGGATAARTLKATAPNVDVTLIETNSVYHSCPMSNLVITGTRNAKLQLYRYDALKAEGIEVVKDWAETVDAQARTVTTKDGLKLAYDRLILSPGIAMRWNAIQGYGTGAAARFPHAWKGLYQRKLLQNQLAALEDGQTVLISVPRAPYRCPPGPYERASLIAHYLKANKPRSKLIILDANDSFSKQKLFQSAWAEQYSDIIEWRSAANDGAVRRVDNAAGIVETDFETFTPGLANIIPPQKAGAIADAAGVTDATGWCPIDPISFESKLQPNIHVIGDATIAAPMPKSAFSANLQGKLCALSVASLLNGTAPTPTVLANTCYSYVTPDEAVSIVGVYDNAGGAFASIEGAGGTSPLDGAPAVRQAEAAQANAWFNAITAEAFG